MSTWITRENATGRLACRRVLRALQAYLDGMLDDIAAGRVGQHLKDCRRCVQEVQTYQEIKNSLNRRRGSPEVVQRLRDFGAALVDDPGKSSPTQRSVRG